MAEKKKKKMEFRYYQLPPGSPILALLGEKWVQNYGDRTADRLHFHNYMELGYCYYGAGDVVLGDDTYRFSGQQFTVIPSNFPHTTNSDPGNISRWEYLFVDVEVVLDGIFPDNALRKERALQRLYEKPWFLEEAEYPKEAAKIKEILNIMRKGDEFYLEEAKALLGCLLLEITRLNYTNKETRADAEQGRITCIVSRAMDYISDHYMEPIRVEQLAKYSHLSETHFRRVFTEYMHMGPLEYINTVRIRTACEHLKKTEEPVADIAHKCGFTTNSTFNRNFKQMMGVTPVEWRKRPENYEQRLLNYEIHTEKGWLQPMQGAKLIQQVKRKQKKMTGVLRKLMVVFGVFFVLLGIMISQAFMLAGFLLVALYFVFDVLSRKEYEYILDGKTLTIDVIYGKRYRKTAHIIDMTEMEVTAPNRHEAVAKYRKDGGGVRLPKFDYTSYEDDIPYYTMIVIEDREKKKLLLDLNQELLFALKKQYPSKVFA